MRAVAQGSVEIAEALIAAGADVHRRSSNGSTALSFVPGDDPALFDLLVRSGVDPSGRDAEELLLHARATAIVRKLIQAGVDPDARSEFDGSTRLMHSAALNETEQVRILLEAGSDVNARDRHGETALMWAAAKGHGDLIRQLVAAGADVTLVNDLGETALRWAISSGSVETARVLLEAGCTVRGTWWLHIPVEERNVEMVRLLLDHGADTEERDSDGRTAWERATGRRKPDVEILRLLREDRARKKSAATPLRGTLTTDG
jgi:uncharacterized protein